jgi:sec-independent protein translocase protein TatA
MGKERIKPMIDIGMPELLIVLVIVVLLFGPGRLAKTMGEIGKGIRSFRDSWSSDENSDSVSDSNIHPK